MNPMAFSFPILAGKLPLRAARVCPAIGLDWRAIVSGLLVRYGGVD
jgi:hypothetical protein